MKPCLRPAKLGGAAARRVGKGFGVSTVKELDARGEEGCSHSQTHGSGAFLVMASYCSSGRAEEGGRAMQLEGVCLVSSDSTTHFRGDLRISPHIHLARDKLHPG